MSFPHEAYRDAIRIARNDAKLDVEADILDFREDGQHHGLIYLKLRFNGRVDMQDFAEGGTAVQRDAANLPVFGAHIMTFDEATGEVVVEVDHKSPHRRPDPNLTILLNPPDYLNALDAFASQIAASPNGNPENRFVDLVASLLQTQTSGRGNGKPQLDLRTAQARAFDAAMENGFTFIWGPPGTGKSYTLARIVAEWRKAGKKILVVAHTNAAVDVMTFAIDDACTSRAEKLGNAELVRYTRRLTNAAEYKKRPHLLAFTRLLEGLLQKELDLRGKRSEYQQMLAQLPNDDEKRCGIATDLAAIESEIAGIGDRRKQEIKMLLGNAKIVCASVTASLFSSLLAVFQFDAVVLDEASIVPLAVWPWLLHPWQGAAMPQFVVAGDPMQLQPVFKRRNIPEDQSGLVCGWFETNIYSHIGIESFSSAQRFAQAGTLVFLDEQFRMAGAIREVVSRTFYGGQLLGSAAKLLPEWPTASGIPNGALVAIAPEKCAPLPLTSRVRGVVGRNTNAANIDIVLALVKRMVSCARSQPGRRFSILVTTPFRNQAKEYEKRLTAMAKPPNITLCASTVHRCQGAEADVVIFDLVNPGSWFVRKPESISLWCVACSRAKSQLFLVGSEQAMKTGSFSRLMTQDLPFIGLA